MVTARTSGFGATRLRYRFPCPVVGRLSPGSYPLVMVIVVALVPILGGLLVAWGGYLGWSGRVHRNRYAGVRTPATMRSDEAFAVGNKVAAVPTMAAGAAGVAGGLASLAMPAGMGTIIAATIGVIGLLALVAAGGVLGSRAAAQVPDAEPAEGDCGGCACGAGGCGAQR